MWAVVGLGNPGFRYRWNRHNIGFHVLDLLASIHKVRLKHDKLIPALIGRTCIHGEDIIVLKPTTYMNRSGMAVKGLSEFYGTSPKEILVVSDDIDLPWNKIRIRLHCGSGGHNGVESIISELATTNFPRLRMGIGRPAGSSNGAAGHVLADFSREEKKELKKYCERAVDAIHAILDSGVEAAMNKFN